MHQLFFFLGVAWVAFCFAKVEIAIEGEHGWAENLPTWRLPAESWMSRVFFSGRPVTGYHLWMELFILSMLHLVYAYVGFSFAIELQILAFFCFLSILEDFLWFVLNPAFGIKKFRKENIWWHKAHWWGIAPRDYFVLSVVGALLYAGSLYLG